MPLAVTKHVAPTSTMKTTFILLFFFFLPFFQFTTSCSIGWLQCDKAENSNETIRNCGEHNLKCVNSKLHIQFSRTGPWYLVKDLQYPQRTLVVLDHDLAVQLARQDCDFIYNFTTPIHGFEPSAVTSVNSSISFFNCKADKYDFSNDVFEKFYRSSHCLDYQLYYSGLPGRIVGLGNCYRSEQPVVEWSMSFNDNSSLVEFSLMSVAFSHRRRPDIDCFGCRISGGVCRAVNASENSSCSCNLGCSRGKKLSTWKKIFIGIGVGVGFCCCIIALGLLFFFRHKKIKKRSASSFRSLVYSTSSNPSLVKDPESISGHYLAPIFSYEDLQEATNNFDSSRELGDGGFGTVYKGKLKDGRIVAVKRLYENNYRRVEQFLNEVAILNRLRHQNLVSLYGCTSRHSRELLLVYEFVSNGTVADHLHGPRVAERALKWPLRMNIAIETAGALAYLHAVEPQIIHRDVKTNNILLDDGFHVKVADFGLSRLFPLDATHVSTAPQGTPGYLDPEYHECYQLTDKSDVYSFGVVLIELISSKTAIDISRCRREINLSHMAMNKIAKGLLHELVDPTLGFDADPDVRRTVEQVAEVAFRCLQGDGGMRPSMIEVCDLLKSIARGDDKNVKKKDSDKHMGDEKCLLDPRMPDSPDTVTMNWKSSITTNSSA